MNYRHHPLVEAARNNDAMCEERGIQQAVAEIGLDIAAVMHIAEQRALRMTILMTRGEKALKKLTDINMPSGIRLKDEEQQLLNMFRATILDGICIGWRGQQIAQMNAAEA